MQGPGTILRACKHSWAPAQASGFSSWALSPSSGGKHSRVQLSHRFVYRWDHKPQLCCTTNDFVWHLPISNNHHVKAALRGNNVSIQPRALTGSRAPKATRGSKPELTASPTVESPATAITPAKCTASLPQTGRVWMALDSHCRWALRGCHPPNKAAELSAQLSACTGACFTVLCGMSFPPTVGLQSRLLPELKERKFWKHVSMCYDNNPSSAL